MINCYNEIIFIYSLFLILKISVTRLKNNKTIAV